MDSLIKINARNEMVVADRVIGRVPAPVVFDSISPLDMSPRLFICLEQDFPGDSTVLYKKIRDYSSWLLQNNHRAFRGPQLYGGLRRGKWPILTARTSQGRSHFQGYKLTDMAGGLGVLPRHSYVGAPGGKLMRAEDWSPNFFGSSSHLYLEGLMVTRRMAKRFNYTAMGMTRA